MPNAGAPALVDGRYVYLCTPEYMASYARRFIAAGVTRGRRLLRHDPRPHQEPRALGEDAPAGSEEVEEVRAADAAQGGAGPVPREEKTALARKLRKQVRGLGRARPARGGRSRGHPRARPLLQGARGRRDQRGRRAARLGAHERAGAVRAHAGRRSGIDTILHYTCRDRNLLGIQSDLLGAYALGLRNILAITGDPPKLGDYPDATAVYDVDSIGLIRIMDHLNHGCDLAGNLIGPALGHPRRLRRRPQQARPGEGSARGSSRRWRRGPST